MIVRAKRGNTVKGRFYKRGTEKQVTDEFGTFLVEQNQNWTYVKGKARTQSEQKIFDSVEEQENKE